MQENQIARLFCDNSTMKGIYKIEKGPTIKGAWGKDVGTMKRRLKLVLVYPNGEISPILEYPQGKLINAKVLADLADLDGVRPDMIKSIYIAIMENMDKLPVQEDSDGTCSIYEAYQTLCEYVEQYEEPGRVFIKDGYGNILASYLQTVLDRLELGYTRLKLEKNFKAFGLLRTNQGTGHVYSYKINTGSANDWFFSFKLLKGDKVA